MKCKDCGSILCSYRTSDAEEDCFYESHPDYTLPIDFGCDFRNNVDWHSLRNQAAIACLAQIVGNIPSDIQGDYTKAYVEEAINYADELVKQLKEK